MKKLSKFIVIIAFSFLFIPYVNAEPSPPSITVPTGTYLYYNKPNENSVTVTPLATGFHKDSFKYMYDGELKKDDNGEYVTRDFIYYRDDTLTRTIVKSGKLARIVLPNAVYYYDVTDSKVYLNIEITLTKLTLVPISASSCRNANDADKYSYAVFSFSGSRVFSSSRIMKHKSAANGGRQEVGGSTACSANFVVEYEIEFTGNKVPSNPLFLWRIKDLDQPDKSNSSNWSYSGTYTESITFNSGFSTTSWRVAYGDEYLVKQNNNKYTASHESFPAAKDPKNFWTSVWAFQDASPAKITWIGTRGVETSIIGNDLDVTPPPPPVHRCVQANGYYFGNLDKNGQSRVVHYLTFLNECKEYKYAGDYCDASKLETVEASCNNSEKTINDSDTSTGEDKIYDITFDSKKHTSCKMNESITLESNDDNGKFYFSDPYTKSVVVNGVSQSSSCVEINKISVPIVLTENIKLKVGSLSNLYNNTIYAGGGFGFGGAELTNYVNWLWRYQRKRLDTNDDLQRVFYVDFKHEAKIEAGNGYIYLPASDGYYNFNDLSLFKDDKCQNKWTYDDIDAKIRKKIIEGSYVNAGVNLDQKFKASTDSNDVDVKDAILPLDKGINNPIVSDDATGNSYIKTVQNSANIKRAYIDRKTAKVTYDNSTDDMIDAGSLYYVPLKYTDDTFSIYFGNAGNEYSDNSFSVIGQNKKVFKLKCDIGVEHILYEKDKQSGRLKTALRYRPIKKEDVFNGKNKADVAKKAQNWAVWYCGNDSSCKSSNDNKIRIEKTYEDSGCYNTNESGKCNKPLYRVLLNSDSIPKIRNISNSTVYNDFSSIGINGASSFVTKDYEFDAIASNESYCNLGEFNASVCDKKRSGGS